MIGSRGLAMAASWCYLMKTAGSAKTEFSSAIGRGSTAAFSVCLAVGELCFFTVKLIICQVKSGTYPIMLR